MSPAGQTTQRSPPNPQSLVDEPIWQLPFPSQQPGQLLGLQATLWQNPPLHVSPFGHATQLLPPSPHWDCDMPAWQLPFASQQPKQLVELQVGL